MPKTPEQTLLELDKIAEQSRKDAEAVRAFIEARKAYQEVQTRVNGKKGSKIETINIGEERPPVLAKKTLNGSKKTRGRKKSNNNLILRKVIGEIEHAGRFVRYAQIRIVAKELQKEYPGETDKELDKLVRNELYRDRNSNNPVLVHIAEPLKEGNKRATYIYGLAEFVDSDGHPLRKHLPID